MLNQAGSFDYHVQLRVLSAVTFVRFLILLVLRDWVWLEFE